MHQKNQNFNTNLSSGIELGEKSHLLPTVLSGTAAPISYVHSSNANSDHPEVPTSEERNGEVNGHCSRYLKATYLRCYAIIGLVLFVTIFLWVNPSKFRSSMHHKLITMRSGDRISISSAQHGLYLRTSTDRSAGAAANASSLVLTERIPWQYGSTFELQNVKDGCFQLKTMHNKWVRVDYSTGEITADVTKEKDATYFTALEHNLDLAHVTSDDIPSKFITLKVCWKDEYITLKSVDAVVKPDGKSSPAFKLSLTSESFENSRCIGFLRFLTAVLYIQYYRAK